MHTALAAVSLIMAAGHLLAAQGLGDEIYRGPHYLTREATFVEPASGVPLAFSGSALTSSYVLDAMARSKSLRTIPASAVVLRLAFGPTQEGMITFRMRADERQPGPPLRVTLDGPAIRLQFRIIPEDPYPGVMALRPRAKVVFTVERIDGENGVALFENPDATELLWEALGRPTRASPDLR